MLFFSEMRNFCRKVPILKKQTGKHIKIRQWKKGEKRNNPQEFY